MQLGKDILESIRPNYENELREIVRRSFAPARPKSPLRADKLPKKAELGKEPRQVDLSPGTFQIKKSDVDALISKLAEAPSAANYEKLKEFAMARGISVPKAEPNQLHRYLMEKARLSPAAIPDLKRDHADRNYCQYHVTLDNFFPSNFNENWDEPYWQIVSSVPQYDPNDPEFMNLFAKGLLYNVEGRITGSYDVHKGKTYGFREKDRHVLWDNTFNSNSTFTLSMWEEDCSKDEVARASRDAVREFANKLRLEIQQAVFERVISVIISALISEFPEVGALLQGLAPGAAGIDIETVDRIIRGVSVAYGGIDVSWVLLMLLLGDFEQVAAYFEGLACPEVMLTIIAIQVAGPIVVDLFEGDFQDAFKELLCLPISIFKLVIGFFTDIVNLVEAVLAALFPDDFIYTQVINIRGEYHEDIFQDGDWGPLPGNYGGYPADKAEAFYKKHGYGPTDENSSMKKNNIFWQPTLIFKNRDTEYQAMYNVKRRRVGGRETFGYSVKANPHDYQQKIRYKTKIDIRHKKIRVLISALNRADAVPAVTIRNISGHPPVSEHNIPNRREFYIEAIPGAEYEMVIFTLTEDFYGYVTLEEKEKEYYSYTFISQSKEDKDWVISHDKNYLAELTPLSWFTFDPPPWIPWDRLDPFDKNFKLVPGLADKTGISFESVAHPGYYLRHQDFRLKLHRYSEAQLFKDDATFFPRMLIECPWEGAVGGGGSGLGRYSQKRQKLTADGKVETVSYDTSGWAFESKNYPNHFICARGKDLILKKYTGSPECHEYDFRIKTYFTPKVEWSRVKPPASTPPSQSGSPPGGGGGGAASGETQMK